MEIWKFGLVVVVTAPLGDYLEDHRSKLTYYVYCTMKAPALLVALALGAPAVCDAAYCNSAPDPGERTV